MDESCFIRRDLLVARQIAADIYSKVVAELSRKIGVVAKAEYQGLSQAAEKARERYREAQAALEGHIKTHRCDSDDAAAA